MSLSDKLGSNHEEIPGLKSPSRLPWVALLVAVALLAGFALKRRWTRHDQSGGGRGAVPVADQGQPAGVSNTVPQQTFREETSDALTPAATQVVAAVRALIGTAQFGEARAKCFAYLSASSSPADRRAVEGVLGEVNTALFFSAAPADEKTNYVVRAGDSLEAIAKRYGTTVELLKKSNGIAVPTRIRRGDVVRVLSGRFRIEVRRSRMELIVYLNDRFFKRYAVGIGKEGRTPLGTFTVSDRIVEPVWWRPDGRQIPFGNPENILGTRWLALRATGGAADVKGYGIHGTWDEKSVGKAESAGCVRMRNADVEQLFSLIPLGTPVTILEP